MKTRIWRSLIALVVVTGLILNSAPALASHAEPAVLPQDGDLQFQTTAAEAASRIPSWGDSRGSSGIADALGQSVAFWAWDFQTNAFYQTNATLVRQSATALIYVESGLNIAGSTLDDIVAKFDASVYTKTRAAFGNEPNPGVDGDARITLLLLNIRDGQYHGGGSYITGYFSGINEFKQSDLDAWFPGMQKSNQREMLYMDAAAPSEVGANSFYFDLSHEFQHMIHWNLDQDEEPWVNEGLSDLAGFVAGFGHANSHINAFVANPDDQLASWNSTLADYGSAYLFFLYLWEKYGGSDMIRAVVANTANGVAGIEAALASRGATARFADIFSAWTLANYLDDASLAGGFYSYSTLAMVDSGADGVNSFQRPRLTGSYTSYAATTAAPGIKAWSAQYQRFTNGSGGLNLAFNGADNASFAVTVVRSGSPTFAAGSNSIESVSLTTSQDGSVTVPSFGAGTAAVLLVAANRSSAVSPAQYNCTASLIQAPTPTPPPTPTPTASPAPTATPSPSPSPTPPPSPAGSSTQAVISLQAGWNLVSLPLTPTMPLTAESFAALAAAQGGQVTDVNRWQSGAWSTHVTGLPFNDFPVEPGRGYFVKAAKASSLTVTGKAFSGAPVVTLTTGWNLVTVPYQSGAATAATLIQSVQAQGGAVAEVDSWSAGSWSAHLSGMPLNNFPLMSDRGYFVRVTKAGTWRP